MPTLEAVTSLPSSFCHPRQLPAFPLCNMTSSRLDQAWVNILYVQCFPRPGLVPLGSSGILRNNLLAASKEKPQVKDSKALGSQWRVERCREKGCSCEWASQLLTAGKYCNFKPEGPEQDVITPLTCVYQTSCYLFFHLHLPSWVLWCVSCTTGTLRLSGIVSEVMSEQ